MENFSLDGMSLVIGLVIGLAVGLVFALLSRSNVRKTVDRVSNEMKNIFDSLSTEALKKSKAELEESNQSLLNRLEAQSRFQTHQHSTQLENKKELIDQQLKQMSTVLEKVPPQLQQSTEELAESNKGFLEFIKEKADSQTRQHIAELEAKKRLIEQQLESNQNKVSQALQQSTEHLKESNQGFLNQLSEKADSQTQQHIAELEAKKKLIDQQLEQMSATLEKVPTQLESNQNKVSQALQQSTEHLKESNQGFLSQLSEKAETQTKEHRQELESKKELIDQRLTEMDTKLGKVERLIAEFESARESKLGALDDQLKQLTQTTSSLQQALADNRARGQWGERMAKDMLNFMGLVEGVNYIQQVTMESGTRPDFTFLLPNQKSLNMDAKFPLTNYMRYFEAQNEADRQAYRDRFLRDVNQRVTEIQKRGYIGAETLDCVLIFIPNEQVYRFIHEQDHSIIDSALRQKVILCSPLTLYIVLAVIRQAAQNFNVEQKSREIIKLVAAIRLEWKKYADEMNKLERSFSTLHNRFRDLNGVRTRKLGAAFDHVETVIESNELHIDDNRHIRQLPS